MCEAFCCQDHGGAGQFFKLMFFLLWFNVQDGENRTPPPPSVTLRPQTLSYTVHPIHSQISVLSYRSLLRIHCRWSLLLLMVIILWNFCLFSPTVMAILQQLSFCYVLHSHCHLQHCHWGSVGMHVI